MPELISPLAQPADELPKLADKKLLKRYRERVDSGKQWREDEGIDDTWKRLRDLYRLRHFDKTSDRDRIAVALTFATVNVIAPSVAVNHPHFTAYARREDEDELAKATISEAVLNYQWQHYDNQEPFRAVVKDYLIYGIGWGKTTWRYETEEVDRDEMEIEAEFEQAVQQADQYAAENFDMASELPDDEQIRAGIQTTTQEVLEDCPVFERISPLDVIVDPLATSTRDWSWVAQRVVRPIEDVKVDKRYPAHLRKKLEPDGTLPWFQEDSQSPASPKGEYEMITLWEFYDIRRRTVAVFTEGAIDEFLVEPQKIPYSFGCPLEPLLNYEVPDQFLSIGDVEGIEPLQRELDQTRTQMVEARKLDLPKFFYRRGLIGADGVRAIQSDKAFTMVPVDSDEPFDQIIAPVPRADSQTNAQLYQHSEQIESDIDLVSGVSEYQRGAQSEISRTATEASIIQDAANARAQDKLDRIEKFLGKIGRRMLALNKQYLTGEHAARITNEDGVEVYWTFAAEDIADELDILVEAGSTQPRNETFRRQQAMQLLNTLGPMLGTGMLNDAAVVVHVLRDGFGMKRPERFLGPLGLQVQAGMMPAPPGGEMGPTGDEQPIEEEPSDPYGGTDAVPPEMLAQLAGQVGYQSNTLGGGALGPGAV